MLHIANIKRKFDCISTFGREGRGERVAKVVGGHKGGNIAVIASISDQAGFFYHETKTHSTTKDVFADLLHSLEVILEDEPDAVLILDNASFHESGQEVLPDRNVRFLPPWSPFLNPIENCFSVLKMIMKHRLNDIAETCTVATARRAGKSLRQHREEVLCCLVDTCVPLVTPAIVADNYTHANSYLIKCLNQQDSFF